MKLFRQSVIGVIFCLILISPLSTHAKTTSVELEYRATLLQLIEVLQAQITSLQAELERRISAKVIPFDEVGEFSQSVQVTDVYNIIYTADVSNIDNEEHRKYFKRVFELFPDYYDKKVGKVLVFGGDDVAYDAYVETLPPDHEQWLFAAHSDLVDEDQNSDLNAELIIHELAHIISYEEIIGVPKPVRSTCKDYFEQHGCPASNSYLSQFVDDFWSNSDLERAEEFSKDDSLESTYAYYEKNEDEFVSDYAASSPEEDFSETFMFFVIGEQTEGRLAQQKIDFFSQYPVLTDIRKEILSNF